MGVKIEERKYLPNCNWVEHRCQAIVVEVSIQEAVAAYTLFQDPDGLERLYVK